MKKPIIGIITYRNIGEDDRPYSDFIKFQSIYLKYIYSLNAIPLCLSFPYGKFYKEQLSLCDGFLFTGGSLIESYQLEVLDYAIKNKKSVLAICNGLQTIGAYEWLRKKFNYKINNKKIEEFFSSSNEKYFLKKVSNHNKLNPFYLSRINESKHKVILNKNSNIYNIFKKDYINEPSLHEWSVEDNIFNEKSIFEVTGKSEDDIIEIVELKNKKHFIIGVQFHIELESQNKCLFKSFIESCKLEKN